jgi:serine/threonine protein kinase
MTHTVLEKWLRSGKYAKVNGSYMRPLAHPILEEEPLLIQKGQAVALCLIADDGGKWILKTFHEGRGLDRTYLMSVTSLLPHGDGFIAGTQRQVLSSDKLGRAKRCYYTSDLAAFLDGAILMPQVKGTDWSGLADEIRNGRIRLSKAERIALCHCLIELVAALEDSHCAHRDFSSCNIFIDIATGKIYIIDFDSLYHSSLFMPKATTAGTIGYAPPFAWNANVLDARRTWCLHADRYALGLLIVEFCILDKGSPTTGDGGMFDQDELRRRSGSGLDAARRAVLIHWPNLSRPFEATINSQDFEGCPSPQAWRYAIDSIVPQAPDLAKIEAIPPSYFAQVLRTTHRPAIRLWPVPNFSEIAEFEFEPRDDSSNLVTLPPDPWH